MCHCIYASLSLGLNRTGALDWQRRQERAKLCRSRHGQSGRRSQGGNGGGGEIIVFRATACGSICVICRGLNRGVAMMDADSLSLSCLLSWNDFYSCMCKGFVMNPWNLWPQQTKKEANAGNDKVTNQPANQLSASTDTQRGPCSASDGSWGMDEMHGGWALSPLLPIAAHRQKKDSSFTSSDTTFFFFGGAVCICEFLRLSFPASKKLENGWFRFPFGVLKWGSQWHCLLQAASKRVSQDFARERERAWLMHCMSGSSSGTSLDKQTASMSAFFITHTYKVFPFLIGPYGEKFVSREFTKEAGQDSDWVDSTRLVLVGTYSH